MNVERESRKSMQAARFDSDDICIYICIYIYVCVCVCVCVCNVPRLTRTYLQQLCTNTGCSQEDLSDAMDDRDQWWESKGNPYKQHNIIYIYIYIYIYILLVQNVFYIDLRPSQTCHSKDAEVAYSIGVGELGWQ